MNHTIAIALVGLVEGLLVTTALATWLAWRLRAVRRAGHVDPTSAVERYLQDEMAGMAQWPADANPALAMRRRQALQAELNALRSEDGRSRHNEFETGYAARDDAPTGESAEVERLRRLLDREDEKVRELLSLRDRFRELQLRYDQVRKLIERLDALEVEKPAGDDGTLSTFRKAEHAWHHAMTGFAERLEATTGEFAEAPAETAGHTDEDGDAAPTPDEFGQVMAMKDREIAELRARLAEQPETTLPTPGA